MKLLFIHKKMIAIEFKLIVFISKITSLIVIKVKEKKS